MSSPTDADYLAAWRDGVVLNDDPETTYLAWQRLAEQGLLVAEGDD